MKKLNNPKEKATPQSLGKTKSFSVSLAEGVSLGKFKEFSVSLAKRI